MNGSDLNANQFPEIYRDLNINVNDLGVVMLGIKPLDFEIPDSDLYYRRDPAHFWIRGAVGQRKAHLTLLYGLLMKGPAYATHINRLLEGWEPPKIRLHSLSVFPSPYPDQEPYSCIVANVWPDPKLLEGRARLELLPHINTYTVFRPHVTLAYVNAGAEERLLPTLEHVLDTTHEVIKIDLGGTR